LVSARSSGRLSHTPKTLIEGATSLVRD
jgi:hypothetical protein